MESGLNLKAYHPTPSGAGPAKIPSVVGEIIGKLIPQKGAKITKGEYGEDVFNLPFKIFRAPGWLKLLPTKGSSLEDFPTMYLWDPQRDGSTGSIFADFNLNYRGLINDSLPATIVSDDTTLQSVSVQAENGGSLEYTFYAPRSVYRYIVRGDPRGVPKYTTITNTQSRPIRIYRSYFSGGSTGNDDDDDDKKDVYQPLFVEISEICVSTKSFQVGGYYFCEDECIKTLVSPYSAS